MMRSGLRLTVVVSALLGLFAPAALADTVQSSNWAGYAVHRAGVRFTKIVAAWRQPNAICPQGRSSYSAVWVGLGGYSGSSQALEQIGSEVDCSRAGKVVSSAWYELVPAPSAPIKMRVRPGDAVFASVTVSGRTTVLTLKNATRHKTFRKTIRTSLIDTSSAEWIVEAPSECLNANACQTLPLANFGSATFGLAATQTSAGHAGTIADRGWDATRIQLAPGGRHFVVNGGSTAGAATPSGLSGNGSSFRVTFSNVTIRANPLVRAGAAAVRDGYIVH
jgi:hypothetical protein